MYQIVTTHIFAILTWHVFSCKLITKIEMGFYFPWPAGFGLNSWSFLFSAQAMRKF